MLLTNTAQGLGFRVYRFGVLGPSWASGFSSGFRVSGLNGIRVEGFGLGCSFRDDGGLEWEILMFVLVFRGLVPTFPV